MSFFNWICVYLMTMVVFFILDILWLGVIAKNFYQDQLGQLFRENVNWGAAALFYSIFIHLLEYIMVILYRRKRSYIYHINTDSLLFPAQ